MFTVRKPLHLGVDLVAPIDHYFKIQKKGKFSTPAGTFDHLIVAMSVHLGHIYGVDNVAILSADTRLTQVVEKCRCHIRLKTVEKSATSGKAGGLHKVEPLKAVRGWEPLKAVRL